MAQTQIDPVYSVVTPVFNAGERLAELVERLRAVFVDTLGESFEIILVDDGSTRAETRQVLLQLSTADDVTVLVLTRNFGKPGAVMCGLAEARGQWVVLIDDDLQQRPEDIPALLQHRDHDMVTAVYRRKKHTLVQRVTSRIKRHFDRWILGIAVPLSPLNVLSRPVVDGMLASATNRPFIPALVHEVTRDIHGVELEHDASVYGQSRYSLYRRWRQFSNLLFGHSTLVLQAIAILGLVVMVASLVLAGVLTVRRLVGVPVQAGWSSLMVAILLIGGLNLGALGITGQYFIRILDIVSRKPAYLVRERLGKKADKPRGPKP
jgi:glycosyltransferase involved in cell wall biosynthesis